MAKKKKIVGIIGVNGEKQDLTKANEITQKLPKAPNIVGSVDVDGNITKYNQQVNPINSENKKLVITPILTEEQKRQQAMEQSKVMREPMEVSMMKNNINNQIAKNIVSGGIQNDIHSLNFAKATQPETKKIDLSGKDKIGKTTSSNTAEFKYNDTGKKYGDYYYNNYEKYKDVPIYENQGKYYLKTDSGYQPIGKLDNNGKVYDNSITSQVDEKKEREKAKKLGYKDNLTKITTQDYDDAQDTFKKLKKEYKLSDKELNNWMKTGDLPIHVSIQTNSMNSLKQKAEEYRTKINKGKIQQYDQQGFDIEKQIYLDTHSMNDEQKQQYISFITGKKDTTKKNENTFFKSSESDNPLIATLGTIGNAGYTLLKGTGNFIEGTSDFAENVIGSGLELTASKEDKKDVTTLHNNKTYIGYKYGNKDYWYDEVSKTMYDENWKRVDSFNLDRFQKRYTYSNGVAEFGRQMKEQTIPDETSQVFDEILYGNELRKASVLGNKSEAMLESLGQALPMMGAGGSVGGLYGNSAAIATTSGLTFSSTYGNAKTEAIRNGATEKEAMETAFVQASAETISEQFFDSIPGAKSAGWGEKLVGKVGNGVEKYLGSKTAKIVTKTLDISGEGFEEIISNMLTAGGNDIVHYFDSDYSYGMENQTGNILEDMKSAMTSQDSMDSFVSAIITSAILNGGSAKVNSAKINKIVKTYAQEYNMSIEEAKARLKISDDGIEFDTSNINQNQNTPNLPNNSVVEQRNINNNINNQTNENVQNSIPTIENNTQEKYSNVKPPMVIKYQATDNEKINSFRQSAVKEGMIDSQKTTNAMNVIEKVISDKDYNVKFDRTITNLEGKSVDGKISINKNGEVEIALNPNSDRAVEFLLTHEVTHAIETKELRGIILDYANKNSEFKSALQDLQKTYGTTNVNDEVIADISGQILGNQEFINSLSMQNTEQSRGFISKVYHSIQRLLNKLTTKGRYRNFVQDLETKWRDAYRLATNETTKNNLQKIEKYYMQSKENNTQELDNSSFSLKEKQLEIIKKNNPVEDDYHTWIRNIDDIKTLSETLEDGDWEGYDEFNPDLTRQDILEAIDNGEIMVYSSYPIEQGTFISPSKMEAESYSGNGKVYSKKVSIDDVAWIDPTQGQYAKVSNESNSSKVVDNQGRTLSKEQQEYFKDSKVRDENGNLLTMYHGSNSEFTIFDISKSGESNETAKVGFWFTPSKQGAENFASDIWYGDKKPTTYEVYLNIKNPKIYEPIDTSEQNNKLTNELKTLKNEYKDIASNFEYNNYGITNVVTMYQNYSGNLRNFAQKEGYRTEEKIQKYIDEVNRYIELTQQIRNLENELKNIGYDDSYEQFRTDIYKLAGKTAEDANLGGIGMALDNGQQIVEKYLNLLKEQGYDGIIIKNTRFDADTMGNNNDQYVAFSPNQIKNINNTSPTTNDDIRYSQKSSSWQEHLENNYKSTGTRTYFDEITNKKIAPINPNAITNQSKVKPPIAKEYQKNTIDEKIEKSDNVIKIQAEEISNQLNNNRPLNVKERRWIETSTESEILKDKVFKEDLDVNKINYEVQSNKKSLREANEKLDLMGYDKSINYVKNLIDDGKIPTASDVALAQRTLQEAAKKGDTEVVKDLVMDVAILGTELGQATQALSIINKLTPEGQLKLYSKIVHRAKLMGDKSFQDVEITPEMVEMILNAYDKNGNYDQNDLNNRVEQFKQKVADQLKTSVEEKIDAWRYLSMLGNPKTHIRNIISNVAMKCTIAYKNALARTIETFAPINTRTKTWKKSSQEVKKYAKETAIEMKDVITGETKYGEQASIESKKRIFKFAPLENISNLNSNLLEAEDWLFSKSAFINTFQEYLTANGIKTMEDIKNNPEIVEKGKLYSVEQAEIATFRQYSKLASAINKIERNNKVAKYVIKATVPFKKTPINVAKAGVKYSPLGLIKNVTYDIYQVKKGNINASQFIDNLSQGLSGTTLTILGYALAKAGILTGANGDDKDDKYDSYLGKQGYSIKIGNKYYSLSWLSPTAMPMFVGANIHEQFEEQKGWDMNILSESLTKTLDPLNEMSFVSSLTDALNSYGSNNDKIKGMGESVAQSYIGQFFPTLFSQFANVGDDTKRSTKASSNSSYKFGEQTVRSIMYKIPGLRNKLEPSTDIWGNEIKQNENILMRALESFILPYSAKEYKNSNIDKEIKKVYNDVGNTDVIPGFPQSYVKYDKEQYRMSAKEYTKYKKTYGTSANTMLNMLMNTSNYKNSTGKRKTRMIKKVYDYSREISKEEFLSNRNIDYDKKDFKYNKNDYKKIVNYITSSTQYKDDD